jgi:tRNA(Ile)-lysidine synthase TilS/MesJ
MSGLRTLTYAQKKCISTIGMLMQKTRMLGPGARIGVAVSGGVDSFTLLKALAVRRSILPFPVEVMALHVNPGFTPESHWPLARWVEQEGLAAHIELTDHGPRAHSDENRKNSPCFFCAMLRRKRLFDLGAQYKLTHLAFGHNAEDLMVTFFMNVVQNGRVDGLSASEDYFNGRLKVVRPALFLEKKTCAPRRASGGCHCGKTRAPPTARPAGLKSMTGWSWSSAAPKAPGKTC